MKESEKQMTMSFFTNTKTILGIIGFIIMVAIIEAWLAPLNPETYIENWGIGALGIFIFSVLYILPIDRYLFRFKKAYKFIILYSLAWLIVDWSDFIIFLAIK